ncbi:MAG: hypothetical protein KC475_00550, partial [Cyanobacteria bacterium HKST-UBA03]|nr:hypothetical protein [Cyanobacteria bacterium HKST-UBA03]
ATTEQTFESVMAKIPRLAKNDPRLTTHWPANTHVITPVFQEIVVWDTHWHNQNEDEVDWEAVTQASGLVHQLTSRLMDDTPQPFAQEYPSLNRQAPVRLGYSETYDTPVENIRVSGYTTAWPITSSDFPPDLWDPAQTVPRKVLIVLGNGHDGFDGADYERFRLNATMFKQAITHAYQGRGLAEDDVTLLEHPTADTVKHALADMKAFADKHTDAHGHCNAEAMVYVIGHGCTTGTEPGIPKEERFRQGAQTSTIALNNAAPGGRFDWDEAAMKQDFTTYLSGYGAVLLTCYSCESAGLIAQASPPRQPVEPTEETPETMPQKQKPV